MGNQISFDRRISEVWSGCAILTGILICSVATARAQTTYYVDQTATAGARNGTTWCDAYLFLQGGLAVASDTIRVASGAYPPDRKTALTAMSLLTEHTT